MWWLSVLPDPRTPFPIGGNIPLQPRRVWMRGPGLRGPAGGPSGVWGVRAHARKRESRGHRRFLLCAFQEGGKKCQAQCAVSNGRLPVVHRCLSSRCPQCAVQVKLELGHRAQVRKKPTVEGFTHDWMVFVRGPEHSNIQHFVEKVVFHLHESFPRPKRGRARIQKELDKKCLFSRRKQLLGPGGPLAPLPAPRVALAGGASGPGCAAPSWPGPCSRPRVRLRLRESHCRERTVRCRMFIYPKPALTGPLGLAAASVGKVQLVVFGGVGSGAGGNKQFGPFIPPR